MTEQLSLFLNALYVVGGLGLGFAAVLWIIKAITQRHAIVTEHSVRDAINELLPQTQCGQCGHPGCKPYAEAIESGEAINKCPPGGQETVDNIATLLGVDSMPLTNASNFGDAQYQDAADVANATIDTVVVIREDECIGCTKCITACPVDAIIGAAKFMHTVVEDLCTGCDLCIAPCPVDCIDITPRKSHPYDNLKTALIASDKHHFAIGPGEPRTR